jgi:Mg-chelatase subunit ChlD
MEGVQVTKPNSAEIVFVIDRSSSMTLIAKEMESGLMDFIEEQRKVPGECRVTLVQFDNHYEYVWTCRSLTEALTYKLVPRDSTALLDALGRSIDEVGARLAGMPEHERPARVLFVVITDGEENSSRGYSRVRVFEMIKHQRERYAWEFMFLGANQDAIGEAGKLGIANALNYVPDSASVAAAVRTSGQSAARYRSGGSAFNAGEMQIQYNANLNKPGES